MTDDDNDPSTTFWNSLPCLTTVHQFAQSRRVGPWALLGSAMVRAIASIGPEVQVPGLVGSPCSLNLFVAAVGPSGHGKGITDGAAAALVSGDAIGEFPVGTGEGLARTFAPGKNGDAISRAIFTASEVDTLRALGDRSGATLFPELRKLYVGESLGFANAGKDTRLVVAAQSYRACLSVGVQPSQAGVLLNDAGGGTPQRFVWLPVGDPDAPDVAPDEPDGLRVSRGIWGSPPIYIRVPDAVRAEVDANRLRVLRGDPDADPLDGHKLLTQVKVAAALALLDGAGINVDEKYWIAARTVMRVSDRTRAHIQSTITAVVRQSNQARAHAAAERDEVVDIRRLSTVRKRVLSVLAKGVTPSGKLRAALGRREYRDLFDQAVIELLADGSIVVDNSGSGVRYALDGGLNIEHLVQPPKQQVRGAEQGLNIEHPAPTLTGTGCTEVQGQFPQVNDGVPRVQAVPPRDTAMTCAQWMRSHVLTLLAEEVDTIDSATLFAAGEAAGYRIDNLRRAVMESDLVSTAARSGRSVTYRLGAGGSSSVVSCPVWLDQWLQERDEWVPPAEVFAAGADAGYERTTVKSAAQKINVLKRGKSVATEWRWNPNSTESEQPA